MPKNKKDSETFEVGRDSKTGLFMPPEEAAGKENAVVHKFKKQRGGGRKSSEAVPEPEAGAIIESGAEVQTEPETEPAQTNYPNAEIEETNRRLTSPPRTSPAVVQTEANAELAQIKQTGKLAQIADNATGGIDAGGSEAELRK